jgi:hypothetical protein
MADTQIEVVADNVTLLGENIKGKVGATLLGVGAAAQETVKTSGAGFAGNVVDSLIDLQQRTLDKLTEIWETLQAGVKFEEDKARLIRQEAKETKLEKKGSLWGDMPIAKGEIWGESWIKDKMKMIFSGATLLLFLKSIFKGAVVAAIGTFIGNWLIDQFGSGMAEETKSKLKTALPFALFMAAVFGKKGIVAGLALIVGMGIFSIFKWLTGDKPASELNAFDWGSLAIAIPAIFASVAFLGGIKAAGTLAALVGGIPVVIAAAIVLALAAGLGWLNSKMAKYEKQLLDNLDDLNDMTQDSFNKQMANNKESMKSKILGDTFVGTVGGYQTLGQKIKSAASGAKEITDKPGGQLTNLQVENIVNASKKMLEFTLDKKEWPVFMQNEDGIQTMREAMFDLRAVIASGSLPQEAADVMSKNLELLANHIEKSAIDIKARHELAGTEVPKYIERLSMDDKVERQSEFGEDFRRVKNALDANMAEMKFIKSQDWRKQDTARYKELQKENKGLIEEHKWLSRSLNLGTGANQENAPDRTGQMLDVEKYLAAVSNASELTDISLADNLYTKSVKEISQNNKRFKVVDTFETSPKFIDGRKNIVTTQNTGNNVNLFDNSKDVDTKSNHSVYAHDGG